MHASLLVIFTFTDVAVPEQAPPQPEKLAPDAGDAVKVTTVPVAKDVVQWSGESGQSRSPGLDVTFPLPVTCRVKTRVGANVAVHVWSLVIVTAAWLDMPAEAQAPPHVTGEFACNVTFAP